MCEEHNIPKVYDPASVEKKWYKFWEEHRYPPTEYHWSAAYGPCAG